MPHPLSSRPDLVDLQINSLLARFNSSSYSNRTWFLNICTGISCQQRTYHKHSLARLHERSSHDKAEGSELLFRIFSCGFAASMSWVQQSLLLPVFSKALQCKVFSASAKLFETQTIESSPLLTLLAKFLSNSLYSSTLFLYSSLCLAFSKAVAISSGRAASIHSGSGNPLDRKKSRLNILPW